MGTRRFEILLLVLASAVLLPAVARAQSAIAGVVKDPSGAVMPGVTVEAASPALIEKVRRPSPMTAGCTTSTCGPAPTPSRSRSRASRP